MTETGIYKIQSKCKPERIYIGSAVDISDRWRCHLKDLRKSKHHSKKLQRHYDKYGESDLIFSLITGCEKEELLSKEQWFIDIYNPYFNGSKIAGSCLGMIRSEESRKKMSLAQKNHKTSDETRKKLSEILIGNQRRKGKPSSIETNLKESKRLIGNKYALGMRHSEGTKAIFHLQRLGNKFSLGYKHTNETKEKMRISHKGFRHTEESKKKISQTKLRQFASKKIA
jgi:group I intron endonuclease